MPTLLPSQVQQYFWGDDLHELSWQKHKKYIVQTLLDKGNEQSLKWLFTQTTHDEVKQLLPSLKLTPKSDNFWRIYLS
jgi:hypothetical protein